MASLPTSCPKWRYRNSIELYSEHHRQHGTKGKSLLKTLKYLHLAVFTKTIGTDLLENIVLVMHYMRKGQKQKDFLGGSGVVRLLVLLLNINDVLTNSGLVYNVLFTLAELLQNEEAGYGTGMNLHAGNIARATSSGLLEGIVPVLTIYQSNDAIATLTCELISLLCMTGSKACLLLYQHGALAPLVGIAECSSANVFGIPFRSALFAIVLLLRNEMHVPQYFLVLYKDLFVKLEIEMVPRCLFYMAMCLLSTTTYYPQFTRPVLLVVIRTNAPNLVLNELTQPLSQAAAILPLELVTHLCSQLTRTLSACAEDESALRLLFKAVRILCKVPFKNKVNIRELFLQSGFCDGVLSLSSHSRYRYNRRIITRIFKVLLALVRVPMSDLQHLVEIGLHPSPHLGRSLKGMQGVPIEHPDRLGYDNITRHTNASLDRIWKPFMTSISTEVRWKRRKDFCMFLVGSKLLLSEKVLPSLLLMLSPQRRVDSKTFSACTEVFSSLRLCKRVASFL